MPILQMQDASLAFGHIPLLENVDLVIDRKERVCLIGRNGTGKSTLLNVIGHEQALDSGNLWLSDGLKIAKLAQEVPGGEDQTLYNIVSLGLGNLSELFLRFHDLSNLVAEGDHSALRELSEVQGQIDKADAWDESQLVDAVLSRLRLPPEALMSQCSGGIRRRAMLGQALVSGPDLLLLDEPTNHLDIDSIVALEDTLANFQGSVLFITHDRAFIDGLATRIIELDRGQLTSYPGSYAAYLRRKNTELAEEATANKKFDRRLADEEVWIRQGIKARRTRNEGRIRRLEALRVERAARLDRQGNVRMSLDQGSESGKLVLEVDDATCGYDGLTVVTKFSTTILRGDRIGIIGANGSGKSTLLKLLLGEIHPTYGTVRTGTQLKVAYFDQERLQLNLDLSVRDNLAEGSDQIDVNGKTQHVISYLRDFLFPPERVNSPAKSLSGGERNRLLLAKLLSQPANLLVLDEPTNDLDVETLELLEELLESFTGTLLLVSHDRAFLDQTVTSTLAIESGHVKEYVGGYTDWTRQRSTQGQRDATTQPDKAKPSASTKPDSRRLNHNEQSELKRLPNQIEKLETQQLELQGQSVDPQFYTKDPGEIAHLLTKLGDLDVEIAAAYSRWEALEDRNRSTS